VVLALTGSSTVARGDAPEHAYRAYDVRGTALVGKQIGGRVTPYALGRVFGGPVYTRWDDGVRAQGTDLYKYQVGAGVALALAPVDLFVEGAALGERSIAAGLGVRL